MRTRTGFPDKDPQGRWVRKVLRRNDGKYIRIPKELADRLGWDYGDEITLELVHEAGKIIVAPLNHNDWGV